MQLENLRIALRPRRPWEAIDLGLMMVQAWWVPLFTVWFAITLPVFVLVNLAVSHPFWSVAIVWWLKPLFDRPLLHVLSRAVFGATPSVRETLRALPAMMKSSGLLWHLTLGRIDFARAFRLPVLQLEGLRGRARRERVRVMGARGGGYGVGLTTICIHLEAFLYLGLFALGYMLIPQSLDLDPFEALLADDDRYRVLWNLLAYLAMTLIEPFYVAAGFGLYLNRRTVLEAWDLELDLRRLSARLTALGAGTTRAVWVLAAGALVAWSLAPAPAEAKLADTPVGQYRADADPQATLEKVLADPDFGSEQTRSYWRPKPSETDEDDESDTSFLSPDFIDTVGRVLGAVAEGLGWAVAAAALIGLVIYLVRNAGPIRAWTETWRARRRQLAMPTSVAGLELAPETLPDDIVATARAAWSTGDARYALSLLYRGAIVELLERGMALPESATEGDVLSRAASRLASDAHSGLTRLVHAWQRLAYAHRLPVDGEFDALCAAYAALFGEAAAVPA